MSHGLAPERDGALFRTGFIASRTVADDDLLGDRRDASGQMTGGREGALLINNLISGSGLRGRR